MLIEFEAQHEATRTQKDLTFQLRFSNSISIKSKNAPLICKITTSK